jgi:hypothetical protein
MGLSKMEFGMTGSQLPPSPKRVNDLFFRTCASVSAGIQAAASHAAVSASPEDVCFVLKAIVGETQGP